MFENPRSGRQARHFTTNVPKILDLKSSSELIFFRKLTLGAPVTLVSAEECCTDNSAAKNINTNIMTNRSGVRKSRNKGEN